MIRKTNGYLEDYAQKCLTGEIVAGQELKRELRKLLREMNEPGYIYDTTAADVRLSFMTGCIRLTKSPFYGQPMRLLEWQKAWISALFGFLMAEDETQRFRRTLLLIARKNAKSETCSALALTEMILGGRGEDIVCSSNDDKQANILYDAVNTMRVMIDPRSRETWKNQQCISCKINGSKIFKLSQTTKNKEGRNIDFGIVDECHEMRDAVIVKSIEQSQSLKPNPKLILITTEGRTNGGFLDEELSRARAILNDEVDDDAARRYLPWFYTQDSEQEVWNDETSWQKSNPTLGVIKRWDYLREQIAAAKRSKIDRVFTLTKDFNIKISDAEAWLSTDLLDFESVYSPETFKDKIIVGGVDLAETTDLCSAKALTYDPATGAKYIASMYWIPEAKLRNAPDTDAGARYEEWARAGLIRIVDGNEIDVALVADWYFELYKQHGARLLKCGYDQRFAKDFLKRMEYYGFDAEMVYQNQFVLSTPMRLVEADLRDRLCRLNNNPVDRWCLENTSIQTGRNGLVMPVKIKGQRGRRIDGTLSLIMAYEMLRRYKTEMSTRRRNGLI